MKCPYCKNEIESDSNFCIFCGNAVVNLTEQEVADDILYLINNGNMSAAIKYYANLYQVDIVVAKDCVERLYEKMHS